ncbi:MAG: helix-turn-helix transcriptional regulator [Coriobacteriales bacterium]|nr:helix-turn-helix transcriptional regulator [Coriobacteriales bacterium]
MQNSGFSWKTVFSRQSIGYAFTLVWTTLVFSAQGFLAPTGETTLNRLICFFASLIAFILCLILVPLILKHLSRAPRALFTAIPLTLITVGTASIIGSSLIPPAWEPFFLIPLLIFGAVLTGLGSGLLNLAWGCAFTIFSSVKTLCATSATFLFAGVLCFSTVNMPTPFIIILMFVCPAVSVAILRRINIPAPIPVQTRNKISSYALKVFISALTFGFIIGCMQQLLDSHYPQKVIETGMLRLFSGTIIFLVAFFCDRRLSRFNTNTLYRAGVALISISIVLTCLSHDLITFTLFFIFLGECFFKVFIWTSLATLSIEEGVSPLYTFGCGWGLHHAGILGGHLGMLLLGLVIPLASFSNQIPIYAVLTLVVILAGVFGLNDIMRKEYDPATLRQQRALRLEQISTALSAEHGLSQRESEILLLLMSNMSAKQIQQKLVVSAGTVNTHVAHIYQKLKVHTRKELLQLEQKIRWIMD